MTGAAVRLAAALAADIDSVRRNTDVGFAARLDFCWLKQ